MFHLSRALLAVFLYAALVGTAGAQTKVDVALVLAVDVSLSIDAEDFRHLWLLLGLVAAQGLCGLEVVEVSPPYDTSDITALVGVRVVVEVLGSMVAHGKLGSHKHLIDKPVSY